MNSHVAYIVHISSMI